MKKYILAIDQSTQGTKGLLFDQGGELVARADKAHRQIVNEKGWVSHDPDEIMQSVYHVCRDVIAKAQIDLEEIAAFGISNQRETSLAWNKETGSSLCHAIVWQCNRADEICQRHKKAGMAEMVRKKTGIPISAYFPASKFEWIMENVPEAKTLAKEQKLALGTVDSWLLYNLTKEKCHRTDYSNASRTQLFNIKTLCWDKALLDCFNIPEGALPEVVMSDSVFGMTDIGGLLPKEVPICGVLGDSHGALFGQNCRKAGDIKATYGTGSSVMMNIGSRFIQSDAGVVTSLAWGMEGKVSYVFEGNLNYTGAVISWLKDDIGIIASAAQTAAMAKKANPSDITYFVPAFTGLGAPYWEPDATGMFTGITRTTGKKEIVKACVDCIAYQITDLVGIMCKESKSPVTKLHVDGGPTANTYLMQLQSDILDMEIIVPQLQELSGMGAAYMAGISAGIYNANTIFEHIKHTSYKPKMEPVRRTTLYSGWKAAVKKVLAK